MKAFLALISLAALSLAAGVDQKNLKPLDVVMRVNPKYKAQEWQEIYAAQKPSPEDNPNYKQGTEPQPEFAGKDHVPLNEQDHRITGGYTADRGQFPWQVALLTENSRFCGGSLISSRWVLTSALCFGSIYQTTLGANRYDGSESGSLVVLSSFSIVHPLYDPAIFQNDIAVIQLPYIITLTTFISPIRLNVIAGDLAGAFVRASGWGQTSDSSSTLSPTLNYVDLTVITNTECAGFYSNITPNRLCCGTSNGQSTCFGDNGGALIYREGDGIYTQVGIASTFPLAGCTLGYPVTFTRVNNYLNWISSNTNVRIG